MKTIFIFFLLIQQAFALDAVVTVLETPMLQNKDINSPVVQYLRKGDVIRIDPAVGNPDYQDTEEFISTLDRQGHTVYVLRKHFYIYYETRKEFNQSVSRKDETDYRLEEPLPKNYPLRPPSGYRGQFTFGVTQPYNESYPYDSSVKTKSYRTPLDFNFTALKRTHNDYQDRFYLGGNLALRSFSNRYSLFNGRKSDETGLKIGVGPYASYDAYKGEKNRVNLYGLININFFNQLTITQTDSTKTADERVYRGISISPRLGIQYHRKQIFEDIDFILGTAMEIEPATTFKAKNAATQTTWWRRGGSDKFNTRATFTLTGYLGIQSAY